MPTWFLAPITGLGLGISDKKIIPRKTESTEQMVISDGIPAVPRNRKPSEFRSEPFRGRENSSEVRSIEQKYKQTLRIAFQTLQRKRKQLGILFRGKNIKANCQNSVPNHSPEEKPAQHKTRQPKISIIVFDVRVIIEAVRCEFRKTSFFHGIPFRSVPFRASELALPRNSECIGMSTFFRGITEIIPSLFRGIFSERNSVPNPSLTANAEIATVLGSILAPSDTVESKGRQMKQC